MAARQTAQARDANSDTGRVPGRSRHSHLPGGSCAGRRRRMPAASKTVPPSQIADSDRMRCTCQAL